MRICSSRRSANAASGPPFAVKPSAKTFMPEKCSGASSASACSVSPALCATKLPEAVAAQIRIDGGLGDEEADDEQDEKREADPQKRARPGRRTMRGGKRRKQPCATFSTDKAASIHNAAGPCSNSRMSPSSSATSRTLSSCCRKLSAAFSEEALRGDPRAVGLRQKHAAQSHRRPARADARAHRVGRSRSFRGRRHGPARDRLRAAI